MKLRKKLAQIFCEHQYTIEKWHWCHGQVGADPAFIEGFQVCPKCGKRKYFWADRGSELEKAILDKAAETPEERRRKNICEAAGVSEIGEVSDGFHTFGDLYEQRTVLFAALLRRHPGKAWKTRQDSTGMSSKGWFIAGIDTQEGNFTYHCEEKYWPLFECQEIPQARFDGHTAKDVYRLLNDV